MQKHRGMWQQLVRWVLGVALRLQGWGSGLECRSSRVEKVGKGFRGHVLWAGRASGIVTCSPESWFWQCWVNRGNTEGTETS